METEKSIHLSDVPTQVKSLVEMELAKIYTRLISTLRVYMILSFVTGIFSSSVFLSITLIAYGIFSKLNHPDDSFGTLSLSLGLGMAVLTFILITLAFREKVWVKVFKLDKILEDLKKSVEHRN